MFAVASFVLCGIYLVLPALSMLLAWHGSTRLRRGVTGGWLSGLLLAAVILAAYGVGLGGTVPVTQAALTLYLGVGMMLWLRAVDFGLTFVVRRLVVRGRPTGLRLRSAALLRVILLGGFAIPWVMAALMVYRPRVITNDSVFDAIAPVDRVAFPAADGTRIVGRYLPPAAPANTTALVVHGLGGTPAGMATLIDGLHRAGIGVLAIDLRAHGTSGGQRCTYGINEKNDALGALAWLKANHPQAAGRVIGVGASLGAAALLAAAADDTRFDGVVVLSTYATLADEVDDVGRRRIAWPIGWLVRTFGLSMASLHAGVDLRTARPVDDIARLWPRPVLIVHGTADEIIPFEQGRRLYDAAPVGRQSLWVYAGTHNGILEDDGVIDRLVRFIHSARSVPLV